MAVGVTVLACSSSIGEGVVVAIGAGQGGWFKASCTLGAQSVGVVADSAVGCAREAAGGSV